MPSWRAWPLLATLRSARGPCPTVWLNSLGIILLAHALHTTTATQSHQQGQPHRKGFTSTLIRSLREIFVCWKFVATFFKVAKSRNIIQNLRAVVRALIFTHDDKESPISQMTYLWSHIFGKNRAKNSYFKSKFLSTITQWYPKTIKVITVSTKKAVFPQHLLHS